jgi:hypothetical protein
MLLYASVEVRLADTRRRGGTAERTVWLLTGESAHPHPNRPADRHGSERKCRGVIPVWLRHVRSSLQAISWYAR